MPMLSVALAKRTPEVCARPFRGCPHLDVRSMSSWVFCFLSRTSPLRPCCSALGQHPHPDLPAPHLISQQTGPLCPRASRCDSFSFFSAGKGEPFGTRCLRFESHKECFCLCMLLTHGRTTWFELPESTCTLIFLKCM